MVSGASSNPVITGNECRDNQQDGASGDAEQNLCESNRDSGIAVYGAKTHPQIDSNICQNNVNYGIWSKANSTPRIGSHNQCTGNGTDLIVTSGQPAATVNSPAGAKTLIVPDQYSTIQAAIDAANPGDTVEVRPGTYSEALVIREGSRLIGDDRDTVVIQCSATNNVFIL